MIANDKNKFGMFIHWGIYSMTKLQEQAVARYDMDVKQYEKSASDFNPTEYDPEKWVLAAKKSRNEIYLFYYKAPRRILHVGHKIYRL